MPTLTGIRGDVARLADWVTGRTAPKPGVPQQQTGRAPGKQNQVPAAVTRAVARARGHGPGKGPGQLPDTRSPGAKAKGHVTGAAAAGGPGSYNPRRASWCRRGDVRNSQLYRNADGSYTRLESPGPVPGAARTLAFPGCRG